MAPVHRIHHSACIGDGVVIGNHVTIGPGVVLLGPLRVGDRVWIGPNAVIGTPPEIASAPQNAAWDGDLDHAGVIIGDDVVIRELSTVHQGTHRPTTIGRGSWLLNSSYVAHDGLVGEDVTVSAGVRLGGHVVVGDHANLGLNAVVHQRRIVGAGAMIGMATAVTRDVPPFAKVYGSPARVRGVNEYVLRKLGVSEPLIARLKVGYASTTPTMDDVAGDKTVERFVQWWNQSRPTSVMRSEPAS